MANTWTTTKSLHSGFKRSGADLVTTITSLCISSVHEVRRLNQSRSKVALKRAFLTDLDAELFNYLIQCIRFGS